MTNSPTYLSDFSPLRDTHVSSEIDFLSQKTVLALSNHSSYLLNLHGIEHSCLRAPTPEELSHTQSILLPYKYREHPAANFMVWESASWVWRFDYLRQLAGESGQLYIYVEFSAHNKQGNFWYTLIDILAKQSPNQFKLARFLQK